MLKLSGVTKQYLYGAKVFGSLDFEINDGEIVAIYGGEGSGKTTLVKMLGAVTECEGEILLDGKEIVTRTDDTIIVFDDLAMFEKRSGRYNLSYPLKIRGFDKLEIEKRVNCVATQMGVVALLGERVKSLSLLEKKRLALARLLLRDTKLILVDNITAGLDANDAKALWLETISLFKRKASEGCIVVYTTDKREEALSVCDKLMVLNYGEVKQFDSVENIKSNPQSVWSAEALDEHYHFERALLERVDGNLKLSFEIENPTDGSQFAKEKITLDASHFEGKISSSYIGQKVYVGWNSTAYASEGARNEDVVLSLRDGEVWLNYTQSGIVVKGEKQDVVCTLPKIECAQLFDFTNENSILL